MSPGLVDLEAQVVIDTAFDEPATATPASANTAPYAPFSALSAGVAAGIRTGR